MITRFILPIGALCVLVCGCSQQGNTAVAHPAATNSRNNRYELPGRVADPLAYNGIGVSAGIPDDERIGNYPGPLTPPITPLMAIGD